MEQNLKPFLENLKPLELQKFLLVVQMGLCSLPVNE